MQSFAQLKEKINKLSNEKTLITHLQRTDHNSLTIVSTIITGQRCVNETGVK